MMTRGKRLCYRDLIKDGNQTKKDGQEVSGASIKLKPDPEEASKLLSDKTKTQNEMPQSAPNPIGKSQSRGRRPVGNSPLILVDQNSA
jgi:hypothetical protein